MPAKPRGRARLTNDPMRVRAKGSTARGKRLRDLYAAYAGKIGTDDVIGRSAALRCAELVSAGEELRRQLMEGCETQDQAAKIAEQLTRLENLTDRAERRLARIAADAPEIDETTVFFEQLAARERAHRETQAKPAVTDEDEIND
jgi:hypothetical protein